MARPLKEWRPATERGVAKEVSQMGAPNQAHPVLEWKLDGAYYDVALVYRRRLSPEDPLTQHAFACRAADYMGDQTATVRLDKERKLLILKTYGESDEENCYYRPLRGELLVPVEDIVEIVAQRREEHYMDPDETEELLCWPKTSGLLLRTALQLGLKTEPNR